MWTGLPSSTVPSIAAAGGNPTASTSPPPGRRPRPHGRGERRDGRRDEELWRRRRIGRLRQPDAELHDLAGRARICDIEAIGRLFAGLAAAERLVGPDVAQHVVAERNVREVDDDVRTLGMMSRQMEKIDIPPIPEFIELVADSGARLYACKATVDMFGLTIDDFVPQVKDIISVGEFYEESRRRPDHLHLEIRLMLRLSPDGAANG